LRAKKDHRNTNNSVPHERQTPERTKLEKIPNDLTTATTKQRTTMNRETIYEITSDRTIDFSSTGTTGISCPLSLKGTHPPAFY